MVAARGRGLGLAGVCLLVALALGVPAQATDGSAQAARSKLTVGAAKRAIGLKLLTDYDAKRHSLLAFCSNRGRFLVGCDVLYQDTDDEYWCGHAGVRAYGKRHRKLRVRLNVDTEDCESF